MSVASVRLYGRQLGQGSHVQVTRGFEQALSQFGLLAGVYPLDQDGLDEVIPGAQAPDAVFTGPLNMTGVMTRNTRHERRFTLIAPNSNKLPPTLLQAVVRDSTHLLAPSEWAAGVIRQQLEEFAFPPRPVSVVPHGCHSEFRVLGSAPGHEQAAVDAFRVLHLSTSDRQRKGTRELLLAWQSLAGKLPPRSELALVLDPLASAALRSYLADQGERLPARVRILDRLDWPAERLCALYGSAHVVCQPSRGEAFSLCPLEATACGVPIVATACTGQAQYLLSPDWVRAREQGRSGVVIVEHGPDAPIDDWPGARDPSVEPAAIAAGLLYAYQNWTQLSEQARLFAPSVQATWSWPAQLAPFLQELKR